VKFVVDASVALKWFFHERDDEPDADAAAVLLERVFEGSVELVQPPHFRAEVAAVLAREAPRMARSNVADLLDIDMQILDDPLIHLRATDLALRYRQHLFDTPYHAVALEVEGAALVTADERYARAAAGAGRLLRIADLRLIP
jgi:predicted nucleic acid-binding protein